PADGPAAAGAGPPRLAVEPGGPVRRPGRRRRPGAGRRRAGRGPPRLHPPSRSLSHMNLTDTIKKSLPLVLLAAVAAGAYGAWLWSQDRGPGPGFMQGNGRIEATEIDIATKLPGRVERILVDEGDFVQAGQTLALMNPDSLQAQFEEAQARQRQAGHAVVAAQAQVALRESDVATAQAVVRQRE